MRTFTRQRARRLAIGAAGLATPRPSGRIDVRHLRKVFGHIGVLQIDSVNVVERAHHLTLFSRLGAYDPGLLWSAFQDRRELFEYWGHEASFAPTETWRLWRHRMATMGDWKRVRELREKEPGYIGSVLEEVRGRGPTTASDLDDPGERRGPWWGWPKGKVALEYLFARGELTVSHRVNFARYYDLPERVIPEEHLSQEPVPRDQARRRLVAMAARSLGIAAAADLSDYYRLYSKVEAREHAEALVEAGELERVRVEGWGEPGYVHPEVPVPRSGSPGALLNPFDPLVWFRERDERLFGFRYRIEIYVPKEKRQYGYYVFPFLLGDRLVARVDIKADRAARTLLVPGAFLEAGVAASDVVRPLVTELRAMASWLGLTDIAVGSRGDLSRPLRNAV